MSIWNDSKINNLQLNNLNESKRIITNIEFTNLQNKFVKQQTNFSNIENNYKFQINTLQKRLDHYNRTNNNSLNIIKTKSAKLKNEYETKLNKSKENNQKILSDYNRLQDSYNNLLKISKYNSTKDIVNDNNKKTSILNTLQVNYNKLKEDYDNLLNNKNYESILSKYNALIKKKSSDFEIQLLYNNQTSKFNKLQTDYLILDRKFKDLTKAREQQIIQYETKYNILQELVKNTNNDKNTIQSNFNSLKKNFDEINFKYHNQKTTPQYEQLQKENNILNATFNQLKTKYINLQKISENKDTINQLTKIKKDFNMLNSEYKKLEEKNQYDNKLANNKYIHIENRLISLQEKYNNVKNDYNYPDKEKYKKLLEDFKEKCKKEKILKKCLQDDKSVIQDLISKINYNQDIKKEKNNNINEYKTQVKNLEKQLLNDIEKIKKINKIVQEKDNEIKLIKEDFNIKSSKLISTPQLEDKINKIIQEKDNEIKLIKKDFDKIIQGKDNEIKIIKENIKKDLMKGDKESLDIDKKEEIYNNNKLELSRANSIIQEKNNEIKILKEMMETQKNNLLKVYETKNNSVQNTDLTQEINSLKLSLRDTIQKNKNLIIENKFLKKNKN